MIPSHAETGTAGGSPAKDDVPLRSQRGRPVVMRSVEPGDRPLLTDMLAGLSERTLFLRYLMNWRHMPPEAAIREAARLAENHIPRHGVIVALVGGQGETRVVGIAEFVRDESRPDVAEVALVVDDAYQREGIGTALCRRIVASAREHGVSVVRAVAIVENRAVRRLFARSGRPFRAATRQGVTDYEIDIG